MIVPVWPDRGLFGVRAVGVSHCREAIAELADPDTARVYFVLVLLIPYNTNPEDPNAVGISTVDAPRKLGHLPRELALAYRERMAQLGFDGPSVCPAAISGGWIVNGRQYDYALELDVDLADVPAFDISPIEPNSQPLWTRLPNNAPSSQAFKVWLPEPAGKLHSRMRVSSWSKPEWGTVNYYVEPRQGIGYGLKLLEVDRSQHEDWFAGREVEADLFDLDGRWATVYLDPVVHGQPSMRWKRQGGHFTREFLVLQDKLSTTYAAMRGTKDPKRKLALAKEGQLLQYTLAELGSRRGPDGRTIKEVAGADWDSITQAYIGIIVRANLAANKIEDAKNALECFLAKAPQHEQSKPIVSLAKQIEKAFR